MDFGEALRKMRDHRFKIAREGWNGKGMHLHIIRGSGTIRDYIEMYTVEGHFVPWVASQTDLLADDWIAF